MSLEADKELARRFLEVALGNGSLDVLDEIVAPDFHNHTAAAPRQHGPQGLKRAIGLLRGGFIARRWRIEDIAAEGDKVWVHVVWQGVHAGEYRTLRATGRPFVVDQVHIFRTADGLIREHWAVRDDLSMLTQLELVPRLGDA